MPTEGPPGCALCGGDTEAWRERRGYAIVRCRRCGNAFLPEEQIPDGLSDLYTEGYFEGGHETGYPGYQADAPIIERNFAARVRWIESLSPPGRRVLDVGAAYGLFVRAAEQRGWEATGIELAGDCVDEARGQGVNVVQGDFLEAELEGPFDVITLFDVIEHFPDPKAALVRARELLAPEGLIVVETGDLATPWARLLGDRWYFLDPPQHLFYFSRRGFEELLGQCGFSPSTQLRRMGRRVSLANVCFKLAAAVPSDRARSALRGAARHGWPPGWLYLNFGDGMLVAARRT